MTFMSRTSSCWAAVIVPACLALIIEMSSSSYRSRKNIGSKSARLLSRLCSASFTQLSQGRNGSRSFIKASIREAAWQRSELFFSSPQ